MTKKLFLTAIIIALLIPAALFAGAEQEAAAPVEGLQSPDKATEIDMMGWRYPITEFYAEELTGLNDIDNLKVTTQLLDSGSAKEQIRLALSGAGTSPYEIIHADDPFVNELASNGWLLPLDDLIAKYSDEYDLTDISQGLYDMGTFEGKVYGIPIIANSMNYFYNMEMFEELGLDVPETYADVLASIEVLSALDGVKPFTINLHAAWAWRVEFHNFLIAFGGTWLNEDSTAAFNGPEGVKAVKTMLSVVDVMGADGLSWSIDDSEIGLETGTLASAVTWTSRAAAMDDPNKSQYVGKIGFAPAPSVIAGGPHTGPAAVDFYCIPAGTDIDPDFIFQVIMQAADLESQVAAADYGLVTRGEVAALGAGGRYLDAAQKTIANGSGNYGFNPAIKLAKVAIENILPKIANGDMSVQEVLDEAAALYTAEAKAQGYL